MIDRIIWHTCLGKLNAGLEELLIYMTGMEDGFDYIVMCYYEKNVLEIDKWTSKETYAVLSIL